MRLDTEQLYDTDNESNSFTINKMYCLTTFYIVSRDIHITPVSFL